MSDKHDNDEYDDALASLFSDAPEDAAEQDVAGEPQTPRLLSIDEVARRTELSKPTLRFYEKLGLVEPPERAPRKFRKYGPQDLEQLERVKQLRDLLGLSLTEIEETLRIDKERARLTALVREQWQATTDSTVKKEWLDEATRLDQRQLEEAERQLHAVEERIAGLEQMRSAIEERITQARQDMSQLERQRSGLD